MAAGIEKIHSGRVVRYSEALLPVNAPPDERSTMRRSVPPIEADE
jgi:hypothetical protein